MDTDRGRHEEFDRLAPADARERLLRRSSPDDDLPAQITVGQLLRVQQVLSLTMESGISAMREQLVAADLFLVSVLIDSGRLRGHTTLDPARTWLDLDSLRIVPATLDQHGATSPEA